MFLNRPLINTIIVPGLLLAATVFSGSAAEARPNTTDYSCLGVRGFIDQRGTVVMNTKNRFVYRKFYAPDYQCPFSTIHTRCLIVSTKAQMQSRSSGTKPGRFMGS